MNFSAFISKTGYVYTLSITYIVAAVALVGTIIEAINYSKVWSASEEAAQISSASLLRVDRVPLQKADYEAIAAKLAPLHPDASVTTSGADISVSVVGIEKYQEWRLVMNDVATSMPSAIWSVESLCAGPKCGGASYTAKLKAVRQNIVKDVVTEDAFAE